MTDKTPLKPARFLVAALAAAAFAIAGFGGMKDAWAAKAERPEIRRMVAEEAKRTIVPVSLAMAVAKVESNFNPKALSTAGARGVMQIMPKTARDEFGIVDPDQLWDARLNIRIGVLYLEQLYHQYGRQWDLALSHYNGGTLKGGSGAGAIPHSYTEEYVASVQSWQRRFERDETVIQLAAAVGGGRAEAPARFQRASERIPAAWVYDQDKPEVERDWRFYLRIADEWMKTGAKDTTPAAEGRRSEAPAFTRPEGGSAGTWTPAAVEGGRPSDALRSDIRTLGDKFRDRMNSGERPWGPAGGAPARKFI